MEVLYGEVEEGSQGSTGLATRGDVRVGKLVKVLDIADGACSPAAAEEVHELLCSEFCEFSFIKKLINFIINYK